MTTADSDSFAAWQHIRHGDWDAHLHTLMLAIRYRLAAILEAEKAMRMANDKQKNG